MGFSADIQLVRRTPLTSGERLVAEERAWLDRHAGPGATRQDASAADS